MRSFVLLSVLCLGLALPGCGSSSSQPALTAADQGFVAVNNSTTDLKKRLEQIATTGEGGSSLEGLAESIEKNVTDPAKKASLLSDANLLNGYSEPERIKPVAKRMAEKL
ncbi:hypothetical protein [Planctomicrobium piriforme]|uniref:Uncharacterized protein n=1 Tax=Planctomicrobium piriforme TaxID=1576369 RepID=A0A1I3B643_9PLAN|nr:hypothetical protein [Planctomicrobium piriforme]SFH57566.1 hypothetical protein SAMN05421753_101251 [Planctomicrobium piriforme]